MPFGGLQFKFNPASLNRVEAALNAEIAKIKGGGIKGIIAAVVGVVEPDALSKTPVSTRPGTGGTLLHSYHSEEVYEGDNFIMRLGYDAASPKGWHYPWAAHDNPNTGGGPTASNPYRSSVGEPHFLESALDENKDKILEFVANSVRGAI